MKYKANQYHCEISFERDVDQVSIDEVLKHPLCEEVDDFEEFARLKNSNHQADVDNIGMGLHHAKALQNIFMAPAMSIPSVKRSGSTIDSYFDSFSASEHHTSAGQSPPVSPFGLKTEPVGGTSGPSIDKTAWDAAHDPRTNSDNPHVLDGLFPDATRYPVTVAAISKPMNVSKPIPQSVRGLVKGVVGHSTAQIVREKSLD